LDLKAMEAYVRLEEWEDDDDEKGNEKEIGGASSPWQESLWTPDAHDVERENTTDGNAPPPQRSPSASVAAASFTPIVPLLQPPLPFLFAPEAFPAVDDRKDTPRDDHGGTMAGVRSSSHLEEEEEEAKKKEKIDMKKSPFVGNARAPSPSIISTTPEPEKEGHPMGMEKEKAKVVRRTEAHNDDEDSFGFQSPMNCSSSSSSSLSSSSVVSHVLPSTTLLETTAAMRRGSGEEEEEEETDSPPPPPPPPPHSRFVIRWI